MTENNSIDIQGIVKQGLLAGLVALSLSMIGFIALLGEREMIANLFTMGHVFLFAAPVGLTYVTTGKLLSESKSKILGYGFLIGAITALPLILLAVLASSFDIRQFLVNVSPELVELLMFGQKLAMGSVLLLIVSGVISLLAAGLRLLPDTIQKPLTNAIVWLLVAGTFSEILLGRVRAFFGSPVAKLVFSGKSLNPITAILIFLLVAGITYWSNSRKGKSEPSKDDLPSEREQKRYRVRVIVGIALLLILPLILGTYLTEVMNNVGIYVLMGLGLNIVVGFAGLLDLGYVAFFAIGAYVMGILTSEGNLGLGFTFWTALPFSVLAATLFGIVLGLPVLRMRGDYLAIVTLGFGEIIRILALSDMLKNFIGGAQGVLQIPKPSIFGYALIKPEALFYVILLGVLLAAFIAWRLRDSRLGRQWMALREDETVAEAMGINLVNTKLLAFATGAAFSGLAGAIFASKLTSIFPHSFNLIVSINVLSLIIVGGIGSLPGVVVGALILVGLPELLREFAEHRLLMYGALLIVMMLIKPEGFWPSETIKRELHAHEELETGSD
jgi:branched-chain amino acid transport system permease protein